MIKTSDVPGHARKASKRLAEVDALRGVAAIGVVVFHVLTKMLPVDMIDRLAHHAAWRILVENMWTLVDLFFVLSGFIFAHVYLEDDGRLRAGTTGRSFAVARIARLYPLHLLTLLAVLVITTMQVPIEGEFAQPGVANPGVAYDGYHFLLNLFFLQSSGLQHYASFNTASWSLSPEALCYVLFFLMAAYGGGRVGALAAAAVVVATVSEGSRHAMFIPLDLARGITGFFMGVLARRALGATDRLGTPALLIAFVVAIAVPKAVASHVFLNYGARLSLAAFPILVLLCLRGHASAILRTRPFQILGDLSFSVYLVHLPVMLALFALHGGRMFQPHTLVWLAPLYGVACLSLSWASFEWFEQPARRAINRYAKPRPAVRATQAADVF